MKFIASLISLTVLAGSAAAAATKQTTVTILEFGKGGTVHVAANNNKAPTSITTTPAAMTSFWKAMHPSKNGKYSSHGYAGMSVVPDLFTKADLGAIVGLGGNVAEHLASMPTAMALLSGGSNEIVIPDFLAPPTAAGGKASTAEINTGAPFTAGSAAPNALTASTRAKGKPAAKKRRRGSRAGIIAMVITAILVAAGGYGAHAPFHRAAPQSLVCRAVACGSPRGRADADRRARARAGGCDDRSACAAEAAVAARAGDRDGPHLARRA